jgi:hypothetical protein
MNTDAPRESLHEWDAAYVLGALSPDDRRTFEEHLEGCAECRASVAELAGMPALLSRVPAPLLGDDDHAAPAPIALAPVPRDDHAPLAALARRVRRQRTRRRWVTSGSAVLAAAAIAVAVIVPMRLDAPPAPTAALTLAQAAPSPLSASVDLTAKRWGTALTMTCDYNAPSAGYTAPGGRYALYVTDASGTATRVASWSAWPGATIHASGAVDLAVSQLRTVEVRDAASGAVLLSSPVHAASDGN